MLETDSDADSDIERFGHYYRWMLGTDSKSESDSEIETDSNIDMIQLLWLKEQIRSRYDSIRTDTEVDNDSEIWTNAEIKATQMWNWFRRWEWFDR